MLTKAEDDLINRMSFDQYMKFAKWITTCRSKPARADGYLSNNMEDQIE